LVVWNNLFQNSLFSAGKNNIMLDFNLSEEQKMFVETTRSFVEKDMMPHEEYLETKDILPTELGILLKACIMLLK
tara:strand:- start:632 stop:856 length:225 start_codon:yes stop_codon:yes gene_type:complete